MIYKESSLQNMPVDQLVKYVGVWINIISKNKRKVTLIRKRYRWNSITYTLKYILYAKGYMYVFVFVVSWWLMTMMYV